MKNKHLTLQDRQSIEQMLNAKKSFAEIARTLEKDKCTISKEVRAHTENFRVGGQGLPRIRAVFTYQGQATFGRAIRHP